MDKKRKPLQDHRDSSDAKKPRIGNDYKNAPLPTYEQRLNAKETDPHRLQTRQSQIDKGYNTEGYRRYTEAVPKEKRERRNPLHPNTPDKNQVCSKRSFEGQVTIHQNMLKF